MLSTFMLLSRSLQIGLPDMRITKEVKIYVVNETINCGKLHQVANK